MNAICLCNLISNLVIRVECSKCILENHRHALAAKFTNFVFADSVDINSVDEDLTTDLSASFLVKSHDCKAGDRFT